MEGSENSDAGSDQGNAMGTPYYTPYPKHLVQKSDVQPVNIDFSPSSAGDSSVASIKEDIGSPSSSSSSSSDSEQQSQIVGEEKTDDVPLKGENRSYDELLKQFLKNEEELKLSNFKLKLSNEEIIKVKVQIEKSEDRLNNALEELKVKEENLKYEKGQVLELQQKTADLETRIPDCLYKIANLVTQLELAEEQLKISNDEIARLKEELNSSSSDTRELQDQLGVAQVNVTTLGSQLDSEREQIARYKANETNLELEVQKLKAKMLDAQEQFSLEKDQMHSDVVRLSEENIQLGFRLQEQESRISALENKSGQFEEEKLKLDELLAIQQTILQCDISCLKEELDQRRNDVEAVNKEFDRHKQKYDMLMTEKDEANAQINNLMAEAGFRDNHIANLEREIFQLSSQKEELISGSVGTLNLVDELKLKVNELEEEVTRQNAVISDRAEEKREAIRQLCFSIEHYRSGYKELLQAFAGHKRHAVTAS